MQTLLLVDDEPNIVEGLASQFEGRYGGDVIVLKSFSGLLAPNRILPNARGTLLLSGKKSLLCYGLSYKLPKQDFGLLHQCQIQLVDE